MSGKARKWALTSVIVLSLLIGGAVLGVEFALKPELEKRILQEIQTRFPGSFQASQPRLKFFPLSVEISAISAKMDAPRLELNLVNARVRAEILRYSLSAPRARIFVELETPTGRLTLPSSPPATATTPPSSSPSKNAATNSPLTLAFVLPAIDSELTLSLSGGSFEVLEPGENSPQKISFGETQMELNSSGLPGDLRLRIQSKLRYQRASTDLNLPIQLDSTLAVAAHSVKTDKTSLKIAGLLTQLSGEADWKTGSHRWQIQSSIENLATLSAPPEFLPPGKWKGGLAGRVELSRIPNQDWNAKGSIHLKELVGDFSLKKHGWDAKGLASADAEIAFEYSKTLSFPKIRIDSDLTQLALADGKYISKPVAVPLKLSLQGGFADETMNFTALQVVFAQIQAQASGTIRTGKSKDLRMKIDIPPARLDGLERLIPVLAASPVKGSLQLRAQIEGQPEKPETLRVSLNPLQLKAVEASVHWASEDGKKKIDGPVRIDLSGVFDALGTELRSASFSGSSELSALAIQIADSFNKPQGQTLSLRLDGKAQKEAVQLSRFELRTPAGMLSANGSVKNWQRPQMVLKFSAPKLEFQALARMLPAFPKGFENGSASMTGALSGTYDFALGIQKSPLSLSGQLQARLTQFRHTAAKTAEALASAPVPNPTASGDQSPAPRAALEPLLPDWPILRTASLRTDLQIDRVVYEDLPIERLSWKGTLNQGVLQGQGGIGKIFGGAIQLSRFRIALHQAQPTAELAASVQSLDLEQAVNWGLSPWKNQVWGVASGSFSASVPHPSRADFLNAMLSSGTLSIKQGRLSSMSFQAMAREKLSSIPAVGEKVDLKIPDARADIALKYSLKDKRMNFGQFDMLTPSKDELNAQGWIDLDMKVDLAGELHLAQAPVRGPVREANSDSSGRLLLPVRIQGSLASPSLSFAEETISRVVANTARHEAKKAGEKLKERGNQILQQKKSEVLDQVGNPVGGGLKKLFGR